MITDHVMYLLLLVVSCGYPVRSWHGRQRAVAMGPKLVNTHIVLILDYVQIEYWQAESIMNFSSALFNSFANASTELLMQSLKMDDVHLHPFVAAEPANMSNFTEDLAKHYLRGEYEKLYGIIRWYAGALRKSQQLLDTDEKRLKLVVLITHGKEQCTPNPCANCCRECRQCGPCNTTLDGLTDVDLVVTDQAENLKKESIKLITIGVGEKVNSRRLQCWASDNMFIALKSYSELPARGAREVLRLIESSSGSTTVTATITATTTTTAAGSEQNKKANISWWILVGCVIALIVLVMMAIAIVEILRLWWAKRSRTSARRNSGVSVSECSTACSLEKSPCVSRADPISSTVSILADTKINLTPLPKSTTMTSSSGVRQGILSTTAEPCSRSLPVTFTAAQMPKE